MTKYAAPLLLSLIASGCGIEEPSGDGNTTSKRAASASGALEKDATTQDFFGTYKQKTSPKENDRDHDVVLTITKDKITAKGTCDGQAVQLAAGLEFSGRITGAETGYSNSTTAQLKEDFILQGAFHLKPPCSLLDAPKGSQYKFEMGYEAHTGKKIMWLSIPSARDSGTAVFDAVENQ